MVFKKTFGAYRRLIKYKHSTKPVRALILFDKHIKGNVLDVGCGDGRNALYISKFAHSIHCIDLDKNKLNELEKHHINTQVTDLNKTPYPFKSDSFETILISHVIEHLKDTQNILKELKRLLKKDGKLILAIPNPNCIYHDFNSHQGHINMKTKNQMKSELNNVGFKILETKTNFPFIWNRLWGRLFNLLPRIENIWCDIWFVCENENSFYN